MGMEHRLSGRDNGRQKVEKDDTDDSNITN